MWWYPEIIGLVDLEEEMEDYEKHEKTKKICNLLNKKIYKDSENENIEKKIYDLLNSGKEISSYLDNNPSSKFFREELVEISGEKLNKYFSMLECLGFDIKKIKERFSCIKIDKRGHSPDLEKYFGKNYLGNNAVIVSSEQANCCYKASTVCPKFVRDALEKIYNSDFTYLVNEGLIVITRFEGSFKELCDLLNKESYKKTKWTEEIEKKHHEYALNKLEAHVIFETPDFKISRAEKLISDSFDLVYRHITKEKLNALLEEVENINDGNFSLGEVKRLELDKASTKYEFAIDYDLEMKIGNREFYLINSTQQEPPKIFLIRYGNKRLRITEFSEKNKEELSEEEFLNRLFDSGKATISENKMLSEIEKYENEIVEKYSNSSGLSQIEKARILRMHKDEIPDTIKKLWNVLHGREDFRELEWDIKLRFLESDSYIIQKIINVVKKNGKR